MVTGHVGINHEDIGLVQADGRTRANHRFKFRAVSASSTGLRQSFAARTVADWNSLPASAVDQATPDAFKAALAGLAPALSRQP